MCTAAALITRLKTASLTLVIAESCSGGLVADAFACVPGASAVLWGSFVSYSYKAKEMMLGIKHDILESAGAVSDMTACAMVCGALGNSTADIALSVTGIAGPDGDGSDNPAGTVWIGVGRRGGEAHAQRFFFPGSRAEVRSAAVKTALYTLDSFLKEEVYNAV
ncbi:MAG: CinA family protein [Spirochaetaceae bacterium]|jgi:PncC family amidohydrolase|nr:CinA family protein [Spirochaetaceae bacterium]